MHYDLLDKDPYTGEPFARPSQGLLITGRWVDGFADLIQAHHVQHLYLNHARGWQSESYRFLADLPSLSTVDIIDHHSAGIAALECHSALQALSLNVTPTEAIDFSNFPHLKKCFLHYNHRVQSIFDAPALEELSLTGLQKGEVDRLAKLGTLTRLTLADSSVEDLRFLEALRGHLQVLELLNCYRVSDFAPIAGLTNLRRLNIDGYKDVGSVAFVQNLPHLEILLLNVGAIQSLAPLGRVTSLKALALYGPRTRVVDGDLQPLTHLPDLSMLMLVNRRHYSHKLIKAWDWANFGIAAELLVPK
ncbi:hypothetical protein [Hymenobacter sp. BT491]|uniref:hypothetical protein n=1 Tax=Hymenobacter sp. BT491 TaxID=2766779 RepID=UPI0016539DD3|nr:hypothetical protein [Hymenobacter sp. BT491]MBC6989875.1 hypothetical protein [Hymenobacter sp. BT491]